jgi:hypothetical protein
MAPATCSGSQLLKKDSAAAHIPLYSSGTPVQGHYSSGVLYENHTSLS